LRKTQPYSNEKGRAILPGLFLCKLEVTVFIFTGHPAMFRRIQLQVSDRRNFDLFVVKPKTLDGILDFKIAANHNIDATSQCRKFQNHISITPVTCLWAQYTQIKYIRQQINYALVYLNSFIDANDITSSDSKVMYSAGIVV